MSENFVLFADSDEDITPEKAQEWGYHLISMPYTVNDKEIKPYEDFSTFDAKAFYDLLRSGVLPKTSGLSPITYYNYFAPIFKEGKDIVYVHFSSAMSGTFSALNVCLEQMKSEFPERKVYLIDTKGITINSYIMVRYIGELYQKGATLEEILNTASLADHFATYFYADNLKFFAKSGRVSNFTGFMGGLIGIKPIIYMDEAGMMTSCDKARGRLAALKKMLDYIINLEEDIKSYPVIIGHSDILEVALQMGAMLKDKFGDDLKIEYVYVNPTAGSHCGPDCIGVAFHAKSRSLNK